MISIESYPGTLCVCIDGSGQDPISGRFYHRYGNKPVDFKNALQMILKADDIFEQTGTPMANLQNRSFTPTAQVRHDRRVFLMNKVNEILKNKGDRATFIVQVQYRQNASWQGKLIWVDKKKTVCFRSVLELIKLMDSAVGDEALHLKEAGKIELQD